jgi:hypothetical protein
MQKPISRREFLKATAVAGGVLLLPKKTISSFYPAQQTDTFPDTQFLGRNCLGGIMNFRVRPSADADVNKSVYEDFVFPVYRQVVGD